MADVIGSGIARTLIDPDGDSLVDSSENALKVTLVGSDATINIGDVQLLAATDPAYVIGTVNVASLDTQPATFDTITSVKVDTADDTSWHRLPNHAGKEVLIQSLSTNVDIIYLGKYVDESSEVESMELLPASSVSLAIENTQKLSYKKVAHSTINQYLLLTVLSNA